MKLIYLFDREEEEEEKPITFWEALS